MYIAKRDGFIILANTYSRNGLPIKEAIRTLFNEGANSNKCVSYITRIIQMSRYETINIEEVRSTLLDANCIHEVDNEKPEKEIELSPCPRPKAEGSNKYLMMSLK